jgi:UDP-GlcNAc:undecaprenyl-phosphate/decaprenyl-phosphate GlcNAc-1-phosphate transferase
MPWQDLALYALIVFVATTAVSFLLTKFSRWIAVKYKVLDTPKMTRKIQKEPIPFLGGLGIGITLIIAITLFGLFSNLWVDKISYFQLIGFGIGILFLVIGGVLDDWFDLKAWQSILFPVLAAVTVVITGTSIVHITDPTNSAPFFLNWWQFSFGAWDLSLPNDLLTVAWLLVAIYATKLNDGLDGLVSGISIIGASMVGILSAMPTFFQPSTSIMAAMVAGSFAGFMPNNRYPAKQYLGEAGSTLAGFCLGFLAIVSTAKLAIALAVLAIPLADITFVVLRRIHNHKPFFKGDSSHLHFRLLAAGLPHKRAVHLFWLVSASAGFAALFLQTRGKLFLVFILIILTLLISWMADRAIQRRLPNPKNEKPGN